MTNYHCIAEYDGTLFCGWGKQPGKRSVQGEIESALRQIFKAEIKTVCAGRTDKGVHALGQSVNFFAPEIQTEKLILRINSILPKDISFKTAVKAPQYFDARKSAKNKIYTYYIYNSPQRSPLYERRAWHISKVLDIAKMKNAASFLEAKRDYTAFDSYNSVFDYKTVDLQSVKVSKKGKLFVIIVQGDHFLYKMVRKMAGEIVRIGKGEQSFDAFKAAIISKDRTKIGKPAPAYGLYLHKITY